MDTRLAAALFVPVTSVLGLMRPMVQLEPSIFIDVWAASVVGDIIFTAAMVAAFLAGHRIATLPDLDSRVVLSVVATAGLVWAGYALAWSVTGRVILEESIGLGAAMRMVIDWGFIGILTAPFMPWLVARAQMPPAESPLPELDADMP